MNMSKQEIIAQELLEIITSRGRQLRFDPDDNRELQETVLTASFFLAKEGEEDSAVAEEKIAQAKYALVYFVTSLQDDSSLGYEGQEIWVEREVFRETKEQFLPCPPYCP
jgi:hypothetical protein